MKPYRFTTRYDIEFLAESDEEAMKLAIGLDWRICVIGDLAPFEVVGADMDLEEVKHGTKRIKLSDGTYHKLDDGTFARISVSRRVRGVGFDPDLLEQEQARLSNVVPIKRGRR